MAIAPRGYRSHSRTVSRLSRSYSGAQTSGDLLVAVAELSRRVGGALRVVTFGVRGRTGSPPEVRLHAEDMVLTRWTGQGRTQQQGALRRLAGQGLLPARAIAVIATGSPWADVMDELEWANGKVLVVGSSPPDALSRVFLGVRATKIIRYLPVPVVVVPHAAATRLAKDIGAIDPAGGR